jgi:Ni/Co efflux regulator RcnB
MKTNMTRFAGVVLTCALALPAASAVAQHYDDHHNDHRDDHRDDHGHPPPPHGYVRHDNWHKGYRMPPNDWNRGRRVDYRTYHLAPPRRGYEWREVDGNYVMAAIATGVIASAIVASTAR